MEIDAVTNTDPKIAPPKTPETKSEQLGSAPLGKLYLNFALPMSLAMLVHGLNNIVDTYFVTRFVGADAIAGVSISFPIQMVIYALAGMVGSGASTLVSQRLGANDKDGARAIASGAVLLSALIAFTFTVVVLLALPALMAVMKVNATHAPYVVAYLKPFVWGAVLVFFLSLCSDLLRAQGRVKPMMAMILLSAIGNIILDAILILGLDFGVEGAAYATLLSQAASLLLGISCFYFFKGELHLSHFRFSLSSTISKKITALGAPLLLSYFGTSLTFAFINASIAYSSHPEKDIMIAAYGVLGRLYIFIVLPLLALGNAIQTLVAYNFGAKLFPRVRTAATMGAGIAFSYLAVVVGLIATFSHEIMGLFSQDPVLIDAGAEIARIYFIGLPLAAINLTMLATFQGIGKPRLAMLLSLYRTYGLFLPLIFIFPGVWTIKHIWFAAPASEVITVTTMIIVLFFNRQKIFPQKMAI